MDLKWIHEQSAVWDETKAKIVGGAPAGIFTFGGYAHGDLLPGEWWRAEDGGRIVGYGWVDFNWADGELLLAVDPSLQRRGIGSFILEKLHEEALARGVNYLYNVIPVTHPEPARLTAFLERHGYQPSGDGQLRAAIGRRHSQGT